MRNNLFNAVTAAAILGTAGRVTAAPQYTTMPIVPVVPEQKTDSNNTDASVVDVLLSPPSLAGMLNVPPRPETGILTVPGPLVPSNETDFPLVVISEANGDGSSYYNNTDMSDSHHQTANSTQREAEINKCLVSDRSIYKRWYISSSHSYLTAGWAPKLCGELWSWLGDGEHCPVTLYAHCGPLDEKAGTGVYWTFNSWPGCRRDHVEYVWLAATGRELGPIKCRPK